MAIKQCADVTCPFYKWEEKPRLVCENPIETAHLTHVFRNGKLFEEYKRKHCCDRFKDCFLFRVLENKYNEIG